MPPNQEDLLFSIPQSPTPSPTPGLADRETQRAVLPFLSLHLKARGPDSAVLT